MIMENVSEFIQQGIEFFKVCNKFFTTIGIFLADPLKYLIAYGFWISIFIAIVAVFLKACGFKSENYFLAGTIGSVLFKILVMVR